MLIFDCDDFQVVSRAGPPHLLLVTFSSLGMFNQSGSLADGKVFWGQKLADAHDYAAVGFVAKKRNWFCSPRMEEACRLISERGSAYEHVIAHGSGMGGYAALRWGKLAGAKGTVAFSPQFSIDPALVGFDTRYSYAFQSNAHRGMEIRQEHVALPSFLFVDPTMQVDRRHAELIHAAVPGIAEIPMFVCGHECIRALERSEFAGEMLKFCAQGSIRGMLTLAAHARRNSAIRIVELAMRTLEKRPGTSERLFNKYYNKFELSQKEAFKKRRQALHPNLPIIRIDANDGKIVALGGTGIMTTDAAASIMGEGANQRKPSEQPRIVHLHIPKTAGTSLRTAFEQQFHDRLRIFPHWDEAKISAAQPQEFDFYSGHIGYDTAKRLGGDIVTIFRHPVDRYLSVYYFWRQLYETGVERSVNTELASKYPIEEFVQIRDQPSLLEEFENRATLQVAYGSSMAQRRQVRLQGWTNDSIYAEAVRNLGTFKVVGIQEDMTRFVDAIAAIYGVSLKVDKINVTKQRQSLKDLSMSTCRAIQDWVYMDMELYQQALRML
jgi:hypothetical protein